MGVRLGRAWLIAAVVLGALPASAAVPVDTVILTRAGTVEQHALPTLLALPGSTVSSIELTEAFAFGFWTDPNDVLAYTVGGGPPLRVDPTRFTPPGASATYYDPTFMESRAARVVEASAGGGEASFDVSSGVYTLTDLLAPDGALLVFAVPVPEPSLDAGLIAGMAFFGVVQRRRDRRRASRARQESVPVAIVGSGT